MGAVTEGLDSLGDNRTSGNGETSTSSSSRLLDLTIRVPPLLCLGSVRGMSGAEIVAAYSSSNPLDLTRRLPRLSLGGDRGSSDDEEATYSSSESSDSTTRLPPRLSLGCDRGSSGDEGAVKHSSFGLPCLPLRLRLGDVRGMSGDETTATNSSSEPSDRTTRLPPRLRPKQLTGSGKSSFLRESM